MTKHVPRWPLAFAVMVLVNFALVFALYDQHGKALILDAQIERQEGLAVQLSDRLDDLGADRASVTFHNNDLWPAPQNTDPSRALQSHILAAAQNNDLGLQVFRPRSLEESDNWSIISASVEVEGKLTNLMNLVVELQSQSPPLTVGELSIRPVPNRQQEVGDTTVFARLALWGVAAAETRGSQN